MDTKRWTHLFGGAAFCLLAALHLSGSALPPDTLWFNGSANGLDDATNASGGSVIFDDFNVTGLGWDIEEVWTDDEVSRGDRAP